MKITLHTEYGKFEGETICLTPDEQRQLREMIEASAENGGSFYLVTPGGYVVLGSGLVKTTAFEVEV